MSISVMLRRSIRPTSLDYRGRSISRFSSSPFPPLPPSSLSDVIFRSKPRSVIRELRYTRILGITVGAVRPPRNCGVSIKTKSGYLTRRARMHVSLALSPFLSPRHPVLPWWKHTREIQRGRKINRAIKSRELAVAILACRELQQI